MEKWGAQCGVVGGRGETVVPMVGLDKNLILPYCGPGWSPREPTWQVQLYDDGLR